MPGSTVGTVKGADDLGLVGIVDAVHSQANDAYLFAPVGQSDFLIDGGATASYYYGPLQPNH